MTSGSGCECHLNGYQILITFSSCALLPPPSEGGVEPRRASRRAAGRASGGLRDGADPLRKRKSYSPCTHGPLEAARGKEIQMAHRSLVSMGELAALMAGLVWVATVPVASQAPSTAKANGAAAKAVHAAPDAGRPAGPVGILDERHSTPLERPKNVTKEFYTPEEMRNWPPRSDGPPHGRPARRATCTMTTSSSGSKRARPRSRRTCGRRSSWIPRTAGSRPRSLRR